MQSKNFEFLRPKWEELATSARIAEQYTHPDPQSAVAKLRTFAEQIVLFIYHKHGLPRPYQSNLNDLLTTTTFVQAVPRVICSKLHSLRIHGNKGAHGESVLTQTAVWLLQEAYELGPLDAPELRQRQEGRLPGSSSLPAQPTAPRPRRSSSEEKASILLRLAAQEAEMQRLLAELEAARSKAAGRRGDRRRTTSRPGAGPAGRRHPGLQRGDDPPPPDRQPARGGGMERRGQRREHRAGRPGMSRF